MIAGSSIRARVVMLVLAAQFIAISSAVGISIAYIHRALWAGADARLHARMIEMLALVDQNDQDPARLDFDSSQVKAPAEDFYYIEDSRGQFLAGNKDWYASVAGHFPASGKSWEWRAMGRPYHSAALWNAEIIDMEVKSLPRLRVNLFYAMPVDATQHQIDKASRLAALAGLLSVLLSALLTWWAVGRGMAPLTAFAQYADQIQMDRAPAALPDDAPKNAELVPLARALTALERRVRQALLRERQFLSDAAHELKTAVAIEKSTLQLLEQQQPSIEEYRRGVQQAIEDNLRVERLVRDMLLLSSLEHARQSAPPILPLVKLEDTIAAAIEQLTPVAQLRSVPCLFGCNSQTLIRGNGPDLVILWTNLIENAIRHSSPGSAVKIDLARDGSSCKILITDSGSGINPAHLPHLFERFYRSDRSRSRLTGGFGLGLSIAKAIVDYHNATIQITSLPGQGTTVELTFPLPTDIA